MAKGYRQEDGMITVLYIALGLVAAVGSLYFAWQSQEFRKFLAGGILRVIGSFILPLPRRRCRAVVGNRFCRDTRAQWRPLHRAFHPLLAVFLFWLRQEAEGVRQTRGSAGLKTKLRNPVSTSARGQRFVLLPHRRLIASCRAGNATTRCSLLELGFVPE